ncbi:carbohydrate sulfotransferase 11-like [Antedon mediterranea]|uniref:carbohydrate sulfotransferase 11-like n=1 Tax=Antedon mediterranea TaxID=105859 RepID=UPI003AF49458
MRTCRVTINFRVIFSLTAGLLLYWLIYGKKSYIHHKPKLLEMGFEVGPNGKLTKRLDSVRNMMIESGQLKRRRLFHQHCSRRHNNLSHYTKRHLYVLDEYKLMYCFIPKVGCSNWKRILMVLHGERTSVDGLTSEEVHAQSKLPFFHKYTNQQQEHAISNYTKFFFVRHPFKRVLSVYKNKFENLQNYQAKPLFQNYGKKIIKRWRKNPTQHDLETGEGVTWPEFVNYLIHVREREKFEKDDYWSDHWREMHKLCSPCELQYDFVGKLEEITTESKYLLDRLNISGKVKYLSSASSRPTNSSDEVTYKSYFSMLSKEHILGLWKLYKTDFILFGYDKPDFVPK